MGQMSVDVVNDPDTQIVLGAGKTIGTSANGTSSLERSVLFMSRLKASAPAQSALPGDEPAGVGIARP